MLAKKFSYLASCICKIVWWNIYFVRWLRGLNDSCILRRLVNVSECLNRWGFRPRISMNTLVQCAKTESRSFPLCCLPLLYSLGAHCVFAQHEITPGFPMVFVGDGILLVVWVWFCSKGSTRISSFSPANIVCNPMYQVPFKARWGRGRGHSSE